MLALPARGRRDAMAPIRLPPVGAALRRAVVHRLRLGAWFCALGEKAIARNWKKNRRFAGKSTALSGVFVKKREI